MYGRIRDFVDDQRGLVGEFVGRKVAERSLTGVLDAGLADVPLATRAAFFPGAEAGTQLLAADCPAAVVARASWPDQDVLRCGSPTWPNRSATGGSGARPSWSSAGCSGRPRSTTVTCTRRAVTAARPRGARHEDDLGRGHRFW